MGKRDLVKGLLVTLLAPPYGKILLVLAFLGGFGPTRRARADGHALTSHLVASAPAQADDGRGDDGRGDAGEDDGRGEDTGPPPDPETFDEAYELAREVLAQMTHLNPLERFVLSMSDVVGIKVGAKEYRDGSP